MIWLLMVGCMGKVKLIRKKIKNNIVQKSNIFKKIISSLHQQRPQTVEG